MKYENGVLRWWLNGQAGEAVSGIPPEERLCFCVGSYGGGAQFTAIGDQLTATSCGRIEESCSGSQHSLALGGLEVDKRYIIAVHAQNSKGAGLPAVADIGKK